MDHRSIEHMGTGPNRSVNRADVVVTTTACMPLGLVEMRASWQQSLHGPDLAELLSSGNIRAHSGRLLRCILQAEARGRAQSPFSMRFSTDICPPKYC